MFPEMTNNLSHSAFLLVFHAVLLLLYMDRSVAKHEYEPK